MTPQLIAAFIFGCIFIIVLLVIALAIPEPTVQQTFIFRVILALAGAGVGAVIPGFLNIDGKILEISLRATGALALFVIIYRMNPPSLAAKPALPKPNPSASPPSQPIVSPEEVFLLSMLEVVNAHGDLGVTQAEWQKGMKEKGPNEADFSQKFQKAKERSVAAELVWYSPDSHCYRLTSDGVRRLSASHQGGFLPTGE